MNDDINEDTGSTLVISSPQELIGSVPGFLGFTPDNGSLVVLCEQLADGGGGPVLRLDVPELREGDYAPTRWGVADFVRGYCLREGVLNAYLLLVFDGCTEPGSDAELASECVDALTFWLSSVGTEVSGAYGIDRFREGEPWTDLGATMPGLWAGTQIDPACTEVAAARTLRGNADLGTREEIRDLYRQRDDDAYDRGVRPYRSAGAPVARRDYEHHRQMITRLETQEEVDDRELARAGSALRLKPVRDRLLEGLKEIPLRDLDGRRELWWRIARRRPADERAEALTLLGAAAYFRGDGVHARAAVEEALESNPLCRLAQLYMQALLNGVSPDRIREAVVAGDPF